MNVKQKAGHRGPQRAWEESSLLALFFLLLRLLPDSAQSRAFLLQITLNHQVSRICHSQQASPLLVEFYYRHLMISSCVTASRINSHSSPLIGPVS